MGGQWNFPLSLAVFENKLIKIRESVCKLILGFISLQSLLEKGLKLLEKQVIFIEKIFGA